MKALIVEDSRLARNELKTLLKEHKNVDVLGEAENTDEAFEFLKNNEIDIMFLDIHMPGKSGIDLLEMLDIVPYIIFTTAYDEFAIKSFEYNTLDYLLKPINPERFKKSIEKAEAQLERDKQILETQKNFKKDKIFIKDGEKCWIVKLSEISHFETEGNYTRVYFNNNKPLIYKSLNHLEEQLNENIFFRASRQHIINLDFINNVENWFNGTLKVTLSNNYEIKISRRNSVKLKNMLSL